MFGGTVVLYWETTAIAMFLGIFNLAWYIFIYTPLKQRTAYALLIGAFNPNYAIGISNA
jgi:heme O synthase-like polyprenyltransferase